MLIPVRLLAAPFLLLMPNNAAGSENPRLVPWALAPLPSAFNSTASHECPTSRAVLGIDCSHMQVGRLLPRPEDGRERKGAVIITAKDEKVLCMPQNLLEARLRLHIDPCLLQRLTNM